MDALRLTGNPPKGAFLVDSPNATITQSEALDHAEALRPSSHLYPLHVPDMMALALHHLSLNDSAGRTGRFLGKMLSGSPKLVRTLMNLGYKSQLKNEGYATLKTETPSQVKQGIVVRLVRGLSIDVRKRIRNLWHRCSEHMNSTAEEIEG